MAPHRTATLVAFLLAACGGDRGGLELEPLGAYLTGVHPVAAVVADLDGDGDEDVAIPGLVTSDLVALENRGGELVWHPPVGLPDGAVDIAAVDIDGDGHPEVVASHREIESIGVYRYETMAELVELEQIPVTGLVTGLRAADVDGDGDDDLLVSLFHDDAIQFLENRDGALVVGARLATAPGPFALRLADLDGDRVDELISVAASADQIEVFAGAGDRWTLVRTIDTGEWPSWVEAVDVDDDGELELVGAANIGDEVFAVDLSGGAADYRALASGDGAFALLCDDFDGDERVELAVTNKDASTLSVLDTGPGGAIETALVLELGDNFGPTPIYRWDIDGDGEAEAAVVIDAFADRAQVFRWR